jgi:hypothetical protein
MNWVSVNVPPGHICWHDASFPLESVQPLEKIMPIDSFIVPIHRPLLMQISVDAQQLLCFALGLHGVYVLSRAVPSTA